MGSFNRFTMVVAVFSAMMIAGSANAALTVHEWGTFTSLIGADGKPQDGMYREDEKLPDFVHTFGELNPAVKALHLSSESPALPRPCHPCKIESSFLVGQTITQKMETPVVYFYADRPQSVEFSVSFPAGIISQSYPAPLKSLPDPVPGVALRNGFALYNVEVLKDIQVSPPPVATSNIYEHARHTASDLIRVGNETEKFIFYRGLGAFIAEAGVTSSDGGLQMRNNGTEAIPNVFLIYTQNGSGHIESLGSVAPGHILDVAAGTIARLRTQTHSFDKFIVEARAKMSGALVSAGLFPDEARAMLDTWENGYFKTPGLRILYVLNRREVDKILPARINPPADRFTRVFVGRMEVLTYEDEKLLLKKVLTQGADFDVTSLGRMAVPILQRLSQVAHEGRRDPATDAVLDRLTERAAVNE